MKKIKEIWNNISKKIKKSNLVRLLKFRNTIKELENKIIVLDRDKQKLNDIIRGLEIQVKKLEEFKNRVASMEVIIAGSNKTIKSRNEEIQELKDERVQLQNDLFEIKLKLATANIQKEEYEAQIKDLKSDRYLVKKVRAGRTPNTNKTKISRPMSANVTKFMRSEHE